MVRNEHMIELDNECCTMHSYLSQKIHLLPTEYNHPLNITLKIELKQSLQTPGNGARITNFGA